MKQLVCAAAVLIWYIEIAFIIIAAARQAFFR